MKKQLLILAILFSGFMGFSQTLTYSIVATDSVIVERDSIVNGEYVIDPSTVTADNPDGDPYEIEIKIAASSDDAEQEDDEIDSLWDDDIDSGWDGEDLVVKAAGLRFQGIALEKGETINYAYIEVVSHEAKRTVDVANIEIYVEAADSAVTFTEDDLITDRSYASSMVEWTVDEEWGLWTTHRTPDISALVQEVVDRDGWKSGNAIAFILSSYSTGASEVENVREWEAFENIQDPGDGGDGTNHPENAPKLVIQYGTETAVLDLVSENAFTAYPSPAKDQLTIALNSNEAAHITIFNQLGKVVKQSATTSFETTMDIADLANGFYFVKVTQNGVASTQKIVVE